MEYNEKLIQELEEEIKRLGCDFDSLGSVDAVVVLCDENQIKLADDGEIVKINPLETLEKFRNLPYNAGYEELWKNVVNG